MIEAINFFFIHRNQQVLGDMNSSNTKMDEFLVNQAVVRWEQQKWIHGGVGYSGIAAIVCASVMSKDQSLIVISICENPFPISRQIGKTKGKKN